MRACTGSCAISSLFWICRARLAYLSVLSVSSMSASLGETHAIISVCALPPSESCSSRVSFESRYGMWPCRLRASDSEEMTLPSAKSERLMCPVSEAIAPSEHESLSRSEPARSTSEMRPVQPVFASFRCSVMRQCERDESLLSWWLDTLRLRVPSASTAIASPSDSHSTCSRFCTNGPSRASCLSCRLTDAGLRRSLSCSL
mmetsp:Transcript_36114/g.118961  ORF Transcript_36114/g.118961 Transcript_36114/m.118961 type:complete len:202 (+) Transcript_36114:2458-3063(+)